jgi:hypothetical protein
MMTQDQRLSHYYLIDAMRDFLPVAMKTLELDTLPRIIPVDQLPSEGQPSFGQFDFVDEVIHIAVANRHIVDILRSIAHELVHYRQNLDEPLSVEQGSTGSEIENQANIVAGVIMRRFGKQYPHYFEYGPVVLEEARRKKPRTRRGKKPRYVYGAWGPWGINTGGEVGGDGGGGVEESKKDACYRKVKAAYKVWPSAYASGALVQCRKKGAKNWGKKKKK